MKKLWMFLLVLGLAVVLVGCGESDVEQVEDEESSEEESNSGGGSDKGSEEDSESEESNEEESAEDEGGNQEENVSIGDTINFDGLEITLNDALTDSGGDFEKPENDHYLILDMTIENTTDEAANVSTMMQMTLQDAESYSHDVAMYTGAEGSLDGEIGSGRKNRGQVTFDVNESEYYEFIFDHPFTDGQAIWKIDSSKIK